MKEPPEGLTAPGRLLFVYLPDLLDDQSEGGRLDAAGAVQRSRPAAASVHSSGKCSVN